MSIKGLTDRKSATPRFTRLGIIRKGEKTGEGRNTRLNDLDYFRFKAESQEIAQAFFDAYGEKPVLIRCYLPYQTVEENWQTWMEEWGRSGLIHRCDGETMVQWLNGDKTYQRDYTQAKQRQCPYATGEKERTTKNPGCSEIGRLTIIIPELLEVGFFGYVTVITTSTNDLANISNSLFEAENKAREFGRERGLQGIEFSLRRVLEEIGIRYQQKNGDYIKTRGNKWMIRLDPSQEWARRQLEIAQAAALALPVPAPPSLPQHTIIDVEHDTIAQLPEMPEFDDDTGEVFEPQAIQSDAPQSPDDADPPFDPSQIPDDILYKDFCELVLAHLPYYKHTNRITNAYRNAIGDPRAPLCDEHGRTVEPHTMWVLLKEHAEIDKEDDNERR
jgi:hypothetical protein